MTNAVERKYTIRRGDLWEGETFRFLAPEGNGASWWDFAVASAQLRHTANSALVKQLTVAPVVTEESGRGILTIALSLLPEETRGLLPGPYVGDLEVSGAYFENVTLVTFTADVVADVTRPVPGTTPPAPPEAVLAIDVWLKAWANSAAYSLTSATRDSDGVVATASIVWPDGSTGTFTRTSKNATFLCVDAYTISHTRSGKLVTQAAVTRDARGNITAQPAPTIT